MKRVIVCVLQLKLARSCRDSVASGRRQRTYNSQDSPLPRALHRSGRNPGHRRRHLSADAQSVTLFVVKQFILYSRYSDNRAKVPTLPCIRTQSMKCPPRRRG